jgi:hypothetical protein
LSRNTETQRPVPGSGWCVACVRVRRASAALHVPPAFPLRAGSWSCFARRWAWNVANSQPIRDWAGSPPVSLCGTNRIGSVRTRFCGRCRGDCSAMGWCLVYLTPVISTAVRRTEAAAAIPLRFCAFNPRALPRKLTSGPAPEIASHLRYRRHDHQVRRAGAHPRESKRLAIASPWSQVTSDCRQL